MIVDKILSEKKRRSARENNKKLILQSKDITLEEENVLNLSIRKKMQSNIFNVAITGNCNPLL